MAKRFTDSDKWQDRWYRRLPTRMKLLWAFMLDSCDNAGIYEIDMELFQLLTGEAVSEEEFNTTFENRIFPLGEGKVWIKKFVFFQYGILSEDSRPHKVVLDSLRKHGVYKEYLRGIDALARQRKGQGSSQGQDPRGSAEGVRVKAEFDAARKLYPGTKNGLDVEWLNFEKKCKDDAASIVPLLAPAILAEIAHHKKLETAGQFVPAWKHLSTWVNNRCWEQEFGETGGLNGQNGGGRGTGGHQGSFGGGTAQQRRDSRLREVLTADQGEAEGAPAGDHQAVRVGAP